MQTSGTFRVPLALLVSLVVSATVVARNDKGKDDKEPERGDPTFALVQGQAVVGTLAKEHVTILTHYDKLKVPFEEVVRIRFHPRLSPSDHTRLYALIEALRANPDDETIKKSIRDLGVGAYLSLKSEVENNPKPNDKITDQLTEITGELESIEDVYLDAQDEIITQRFTIKGHILDSLLHVTRGKLKLTIPIADVRHIAYGDLIVRKIFKVNSQHMEGSNGFLDTKYKVKKGQRFTLTPSGQMTWQGQAFGPAGLSNHTWNSRKMGCLQYRIGKGPWKVLAASMEIKSDASGTIQLCTHLTGSAPAGEFKVEFKMKKK